MILESLSAETRCMTYLVPKTNKGGAVFAHDRCTVNATRTVIANNTATRGPGVMCQYDSLLGLTRHVRVVGNTAGHIGALYALRRSTIELVGLPGGSNRRPKPDRQRNRSQDTTLQTRSRIRLSLSLSLHLSLYSFSHPPFFPTVNFGSF